MAPRNVHAQHLAPARCLVAAAQDPGRGLIPAPDLAVGPLLDALATHQTEEEGEVVTLVMQATAIEEATGEEEATMVVGMVLLAEEDEDTGGLAVALDRLTVSGADHLATNVEAEELGPDRTAAARGRVLARQSGVLVTLYRGPDHPLVRGPLQGVDLTPPTLGPPGVVEAGAPSESGHVRGAQSAASVPEITVCPPDPALAAVVKTEAEAIVDWIVNDAWYIIIVYEIVYSKYPNVRSLNRCHPYPNLFGRERTPDHVF